MAYVHRREEEQRPRENWENRDNGEEEKEWNFLTFLSTLATVHPYPPTEGNGKQRIHELCAVQSCRADHCLDMF